MSSGQVEWLHVPLGCSLLFFHERKPKVTGGRWRTGRKGRPVVTAGKHVSAQRVWLLLVHGEGQAKQSLWGGGALTSQGCKKQELMGIR